MGHDKNRYPTGIPQTTNDLRTSEIKIKPISRNVFIAVFGNDDFTNYKVYDIYKNVSDL